MLQLRISAGTAKNKKLIIPEIPDFRPAQEVVKQAIFAILAEKTVGAKSLDLFAGSGNLGIEALSRGAAWCDFVDSNYEAQQTIEKNLFNCGFLDQAEVFRKEAVKFAEKAADTGKTYDLIFMDPFYKDTTQKFLMKQVAKLLNKDGNAIILYGEELNLDTIINGTNLEAATTRRFGATRFTFLRRSLSEAKSSGGKKAELVDGGKRRDESLAK